MKAVLLDRDGVLNVDLPGSTLSVEQVELIPGAGDAVRRINQAGYLAIVVTNQACVGRGELSREGLDAINRAIEAGIAARGGRIEAWFVCAHKEGDGCACRKPKPGLLLEAAARYSLDLGETFFVGDAERDVEAAIAAGARPAIVLTGKGKAASAAYPGVPAYRSLGAFADSLSGGRI